MLREEVFSWFKKNVIKVSEVCVMLNNMKQEGVFIENAQADEQGANLVAELYEEEFNVYKEGDKRIYRNYRIRKSLSL